MLSTPSANWVTRHAVTRPPVTQHIPPASKQACRNCNFQPAVSRGHLGVCAAACGYYVSAGSLLSYPRSAALACPASIIRSQPSSSCQLNPPPHVWRPPTAPLSAPGVPPSSPRPHHRHLTPPIVPSTRCPPSGLTSTTMPAAMRARSMYPALLHSLAAMAALHRLQTSSLTSKTADGDLITSRTLTSLLSSASGTTVVAGIPSCMG